MASELMWLCDLRFVRVSTWLGVSCTHGVVVDVHFGFSDLLAALVGVVLYMLHGLEQLLALVDAVRCFVKQTLYFLYLVLVEYVLITDLLKKPVCELLT